MDLSEGIHKLELLKSSIKDFMVDQSGVELKNIVEEIIITLRSIKVDKEYKEGLEDDALGFEEFLESEIKYFSNCQKGVGKQTRLNRTKVLITHDLRLILFSLRIKLAEQ